MSENAPRSAPPSGSQRVALISALVVGVAIAIYSVLGGIGVLASNAVYGNVGSSFTGALEVIVWTFFVILIRAAVVFVVAWRVVPVDERSRLPRIFISAAVAAVLVAVVEALAGVVQSLRFSVSVDRSFFADSFPQIAGIPDVFRGFIIAVIDLPENALIAFPLIALVLLVVARHRHELRAR